MKLLKILLLSLPLLFTAPIFAATNTSTEAKNDATALSIISTIDKIEIDAAKLALTKNPPEDVKNYAKFLKKEHSANFDQAQSLNSKLKLPLVVSTDVKNLQKQGKADAAELSALTGNDFANQYIEKMVQGHTDALNTINNKLLPSVKDPTVKNFILATRKHVELHLQKAKAIQAELATSNQTTTTTSDGTT